MGYADLRGRGFSGFSRMAGRLLLPPVLSPVRRPFSRGWVGRLLAHAARFPAIPEDGRDNRNRVGRQFLFPR